MADSQPLSGAPEGAEYLRAVLRAPVYEAAQVTPLQKMEKLSSRLDNVILVKREDRQPVHSFKLRGAYADWARANGMNYHELLVFYSLHELGSCTQKQICARSTVGRMCKKSGC